MGGLAARAAGPPIAVSGQPCSPSIYLNTLSHEELFLYSIAGGPAWPGACTCILKTQLVRHGRPTAWCAQYDEVSLLPAKTRAFELPSLSGDESVGIVRFLMDTEQPSAEVKAAVDGAWFEQVKMPGYSLKEIPAPQEPRGIDRVIVAQPGATLWARFYELDTNRPIYVGRDSQVHYQLREIENERRAGYLYAGIWPAELLAVEYPAWVKRVGSEAHN